ncbi:MAG TPA: APC family permease [Dongiaceae bacterium]|nr:APC family permease [Dongiaceae bacterium]
MATVATSPPIASSVPSQSPSAALRKELGFVDMVFASVLLVVIPDFFGTAVKAGATHVSLWLLAIVFFFLPQAFVVNRLNRALPLEGGLYEWARVAFGDRIGFLVAWNLWVYVVFYVATVGLVATNYLSYVLGPSFSWLATNRRANFVISVAVLVALVLVTRAGMGIGKWVTNAGSLFTVITISVLAAVPFFRFHHSTTPYHPLQFVWPTVSLFSLSVFGKMTFGALCGLEYLAIFSGESRNPSRHFTRAILIAVPLIAVLYIFGTSAILAFVTPETVDVIAPIPQALSLGFAGVPVARFVAPIAILLLLTNYLASFNLSFAANSRLPMVAGWDHLLPQWFTTLHPKYRTPVNSVLFVGVVTLVASVAVLVGVHEDEAFEMLQIWAFTFYGFTYLALFAIPLFAPRSTGLRAGLAVQLAAVSGLALTLLFVALSIFPIINVANRFAYSAKTVAVLLGMNLLGLLVFYSQRRRRQES